MNISRVTFGIGKLLIFSLAIMFTLYACEKQETSYQKLQKEQDMLNQYIIDSNITVEPKTSGLYYIETLAGSGEKVTVGRLITVKYVGKFLDGTVFDQSGVEPFEFMVGYGEVISGWDEGVRYMKDGGKATLIIPSTLGYGPYGKGTIPGYTTLLFDIEITNVQ
jgi:FKBP-type peptidyl-prolyl cis-trans isomerase